MKTKLVRVVGIAVVMAFLLLSLSACNKDDNAGDTPAIVPPVSSTEGDDNGVNPPENLGDPNDVNFNLQGPGDTNFDDVGLNGSQPGVSAVGDPTGGDEFSYDIPSSGDETPTDQTPNLNNQPGEGDDTTIDGTDPVLTMEEDTTSDSEESQTTQTEEPPEETPTIPEEIKLPNTGMFLEDD